MRDDGRWRIGFSLSHLNFTVYSAALLVIKTHIDSEHDCATQLEDLQMQNCTPTGHLLGAEEWFIFILNRSILMVFHRLSVRRISQNIRFDHILLAIK
jgi:hypothetical protein